MATSPSVRTPHPFLFCARLLSCRDHGRIPPLFIRFALSIRNTIRLSMLPHPALPHTYSPPCPYGHKNSLRPFSRYSLRAFILFFSPSGWDIVTVHITSKHHKHKHTYGYQYRGCSSNHLARKTRKRLLGSPKHRGVENKVSTWLGME